MSIQSIGSPILQNGMMSRPFALQPNHDIGEVTSAADNGTHLTGAKLLVLVLASCGLWTAIYVVGAAFI